MHPLEIVIYTYLFGFWLRESSRVLFSSFYPSFLHYLRDNRLDVLMILLLSLSFFSRALSSSIDRESAEALFLYTYPAFVAIVWIRMLYLLRYFDSLSGFEHLVCVFFFF